MQGRIEEGAYWVATYCVLPFGGLFYGLMVFIALARRFRFVYLFTGFPVQNAFVTTTYLQFLEIAHF